MSEIEIGDYADWLRQLERDATRIMQVVEGGNVTEDLAGWLLTQIQADEDFARPESEEDPPLAWAVFRLAECDAKRRIIEIHKQAFVLCGFDEEAYPCVHLRLLALPFADRPGYRAEWAPS